MNILWITARKLGQDLASSTEISISKEIFRNNKNIQIISPSKYEFTEDIRNHEVKFLKIKGLESLTGGNYIKKVTIRKDIQLDSFDVLIVDWRYVYSLRKILSKKDLKWVLIDRGPPAYDGIIAKLQNRFWKYGWEFANKFAIGGFVVSDKHRDYVKRTNSIGIDIEIIKAGVFTSEYPIKTNKSPSTIKFIYIGRIEKNRGLDKIKHLSKRLIEEKIKFEIHIYGEGGYVKNLIRQKNLGVFIHKKVKKSEIPQILTEAHVGLMPMPEKEIWEISSPLKLAEYLAAGLVIMGVEHSGNNIGKDTGWSLLGSQNEWIDEGIEGIKRINQKEEWVLRSNYAISHAKEMDWRLIVKNMLRRIRLWIN